jgi:uncharacterized protein (DUF608 family)
MIPKVKKNVIYRKEKIFRKVENDYDFLKYYSVIKKWTQINNGLSSSDLDFLVYLYSEKLFTRQQFRDHANHISWDSNRFKRLLDNGWIYIWRKGAMHEANLYDTSYKAKKMVNTMYKRLLGLEPLPESTRRSKILKKKAPYNHKVLAMAVTRVNKETKERKQRPSPELQ